MSLFNCIAEIVKDDPSKRELGEKAQKLWRETADMYEAQGHPRHMAEVRAAEDVKASFKKEAGDKRHVYLAALAAQRKQQIEVSSLKGEKAVKRGATEAMERLERHERALVRRFNGMMAEFLRKHHTNTIGTVKDRAGMLDVVRELHGQASGNANAKALAEAVRNAMEDMRLSFNEAGGLIGKMDNWGLPHSHNARQIERAGFDQWFKDVDQRIDWTRMENRATGNPFQKEGGMPPPEPMRRRFMEDIYRNIVFGKEVDSPTYGMRAGEPVYKRHSESRVLHFKTADDWIAYNKTYGTGDPYRSLTAHVHGMAKDIAQMREFGPNAKLGLEYRNQLLLARAEKEFPGAFKQVQGDTNWANRMMKIYNGPGVPSGPAAAFVARFMATTRNFVSSAFLDRAMLASISDLNTMQLAARAIGLNPKNVMSTYVNTISAMVKEGSMATDDVLRLGWVMDTLSDPGAAAARFDGEFVASEVSQRLLNASMRVQGLAQHTDAMRFAIQSNMWGNMASMRKMALKDIKGPFGDSLRKTGLTEAQWKEFTSILQTAPNGATFANPLYWRAETKLPRRQADDIYLKIQDAVEEWSERAVPTNSLYARGALDPSRWDMSPGHLDYELFKSAMMFKSFIMTVTVNQHRMVQLNGGYWSPGGISYLGQFMGGATIMGALSLQLVELSKGNDPMPMDEPMFWARAALKGGGFGPVGDIFAAGQTSWGGGFSSYLAGPMPQVAQDAWNLTIKNAIQAMTGGDANFAQDLATAGKRYTPMGQTPLVGPFIDRAWWDQMQIILDPESINDTMRKAQSRENLFGNAAYWQPGHALPSRAPDLSTVFGR